MISMGPDEFSERIRLNNHKTKIRKERNKSQDFQVAHCWIR